MVIITQLNHVRPLQLDFERTWAIISVVVLVEVHLGISVFVEVPPSLWTPPARYLWRSRAPSGRLPRAICGGPALPLDASRALPVLPLIASRALFVEVPRSLRRPPGRVSGGPEVP